MRIAITGGRDHRPTAREMELFEELWQRLGGHMLIHGQCPDPGNGKVSVDMELDRWALFHGVQPARLPAVWQANGRAAGPIRNGFVVELAEALIAFPGGSGTADCVRQASAKGIPVHFVKEGDKAGEEVEHGE